MTRSASHGEYPNVQISKSIDIYELMSPMSNEPQEVLSVVLLDTKNIVIGICEVSRGGISSTVVEAQTIFKPALLSNATGIIMVHNHPSGNVEHSPDDIELSGLIEESAKMLGIRLLDFVIIGHKEYKSFADSGLI